MHVSEMGTESYLRPQTDHHKPSDCAKVLQVNENIIIILLLQFKPDKTNKVYPPGQVCVKKQTKENKQKKQQKIKRVP